MPEFVDVFPFAAKVLTQDNEYVVLWDDPRDIQRVDVVFAAPLAREQLPALHYWQHTWPRVRVAPNAIVGAGDQGWLPIDDWITGGWRPAAVQVEGEGTTWRYTFQPLDREDVPAAHEFPVRFRRTLKLRLSLAEGLPELAQMHVFTDSEWREAELCLEWGGLRNAPESWDGYLEAFNGSVLAVAPLNAACQPDASGGWRSRVNGTSGGVRARVRYAWNPDRNSYDCTLLTLRRAHGRSFTVCINDIVAGETVYLPDFGAVVALAEGYPGLETLRSRWESGHGRTTRERVAALPEQTWERAWAEMPPKRRFYFVLGCEGGRQKFRLEPNGDLLLPENFVRRVPGRDSERLRWTGSTLHYRFGLPEPDRRGLLDGYLPLMQTHWMGWPLTLTQDAFATWLYPASPDGEHHGDDPVVALLRFTWTNAGSETATAQLALQTADASAPCERLRAKGALIHALVGGEQRLRLAFDAEGAPGTLEETATGLLYRVILAPGETHALTLRIPFVTLDQADELAALARLNYVVEAHRVADFWRARVAEGMQIDTPNETLNRFHRAHLTHMLIVNDREPGSTRRAPRCGGFSYGNYPDEGVMGISDLDRRGYTEVAEQCLEIMLHYQGTVPLPGDFQTQDGVLYGSNGYEAGGYNRGQGWAMWGLAEHYRYTRDHAWLERAAPAMVRACDWVTRERRRTMQLLPDGRRPIDYGFLPAGSLEDVSDYWHWLSTNAYACWGFKAIADVLSEAGHPEAARLRQDAEAFHCDLLAGFNESSQRAPVVRLGDGRYVPYYPPRLERRGRDFGWLREVLEGAMGLLVAGLLPLADPAATWILDDYEDNLYLSPQYGYADSVSDYEQDWFSRGGFSMQSNLLLHPAVYLRRDEIKSFLRAFFNGFASTFYPETCMLAEHALPTLADARGDHFKTSDEANVTHYLRLMLIEEHGQDLLLGKAIPRAWLAHGQTVRVQRALTYFGTLSYSLRSFADVGRIEAELELPQRNPPARAFLRLRHPRAEPLRRVMLNGQPWPRFDPATEQIELPLAPGLLHVQAFYR